MTGDEFPHTFIGRIVELAKVVGSLTVLASTASLIWAMTVGPVAGFIDEWREMQVAIATLHKDVRSLKGEDRVIREITGLTYISEPVRVGEDVQFNMVLERTQLGEPCIYISSTPIYTDERNIPIPGPRKMGGRQISTDPTPLASIHQLAKSLRPGRVVGYLILEYQCNGKTVFDRTSSVPFLLLQQAEKG